MKRILFQGDSITDCGRSRDNDSNKGKGYATNAMGKLNYRNPGEYEFFNRGIGGNRVTDLYARIKADIINLKPDYMSILIGVNDVWHEVKRQDGVSAEKYEKIYDMLISEVLEALPDIKIMIMEPFVLKSSETQEHWEVFTAEVAKRAAAAKRIAEKYGFVYVPLQEKFDEMVEKQPEPYWTMEGVHPTEAGHELITEEWLKGFEKLN
jgi:lysophospholipase L1-like esterase